MVTVRLGIVVDSCKLAVSAPYAISYEHCASYPAEPSPVAGEPVEYATEAEDAHAYVDNDHYDAEYVAHSLRCACLITIASHNG